jgi:type 1 glutamine amidotransferase
MRHRLVIVCLLAAPLLARALVVTRAQAPAPKRVLFLTHAALYKHASLAPAERAVVDIGRSGGFDVTTLDGYAQDSSAIDLSMITSEYLARYDALMLMTNGNLPLTDAQKRSIVDYVRNGKALVGVHCASLTLYNYPEFGEMLGGYYRRSIVPTTRIGQTNLGVLKVEDATHPATRMLGASWPLAEEFYQFGTAVWDPAKPTENVSQVGRLPIPLAFTRDRVHVLLSLDTEKMDLTGLGPEIVKGGDYPQAWTRSYGRGRVFYSALGHRDDIWSSDQLFRAHISGGIRWAVGLEH